MTTSRVALQAHPYADAFPLLPEAELAELIESIRANGLRQPVVVTTDGRILDGRNRAAACAALDIEPETVVYDGPDLAEYVIDCNVTRRNMSTGARAMATALVLQADGRRENGRWRRGSVGNGQESISDVDSAWIKAMKRAGVVLDFTPDAADDVVHGRVSLNAAFEQADGVRQSAERDRILERERRRREKEEAAAEAEQNAQIVTELTQAQSKYLPLIESGDLTPAAAWAAYCEDTRKERRAEEELDRGRRDTCTRIAECVRFLEGGEDYAAIFLREFYPHEARFLADGMRLTRARARSAADFLNAIEKGLNR